jgi:23S rRNA pseudouridine2605 synthase
MEERLQKLLSRAGVASRRKAEELITQGGVSVNDEIVTELGSKADPDKDKIKVHGRLISQPTEFEYLMLHKPTGYITTTHDPEGRRTVLDLLGKAGRNVYPVGRLDYASEGLLLLTNDGDLANRIMSAKSKMSKTYSVKVNGSINHEAMERFRAGIYLDGRKTAPAQIKLTKFAANPWYEVVLTEGRNRQIRRMFERFGVLVEKIKRTRVGPVYLGKLASGKFRTLTEREITRLNSDQVERPPSERRKRVSDSKGGPDRRRRRPVG